MDQTLFQKFILTFVSLRFGYLGMQRLLDLGCNVSQKKVLYYVFHQVRVTYKSSTMVGGWVHHLYHDHELSSNAV